MAYNGSVELISGIKQKNDQNFPLVDASAVRVDDSTRLDAKLAELDGRAFIIFSTSGYSGEGDSKFSITDMPDNSIAYCTAKKFADKPKSTDDPNGHGVADAAYIRIYKLSYNSYGTVANAFLWDGARNELWIGQYTSSGTTPLVWTRMMDQDDRDTLKTKLDEVDAVSWKWFNTSGYSGEGDDKFSLADMPAFSRCYGTAKRLLEKPEDIADNALLRIFKLPVNDPTYNNVQIVFLWDSSSNNLWIGEYTDSAQSGLSVTWRRMAKDYDLNTLDSRAMRWLTTSERNDVVSAVYNESTFPWGKYFSAKGRYLKVLFPATVENPETHEEETFFPYSDNLSDDSTYWVISYKITGDTPGTIDIISPGGLTHYRGFVVIATRKVNWFDLSPKNIDDLIADEPHKFKSISTSAVNGITAEDFPFGIYFSAMGGTQNAPNVGTLRYIFGEAGNFEELPITDVSYFVLSYEARNTTWTVQGIIDIYRTNGTEHYHGYKTVSKTTPPVTTWTWRDLSLKNVENRVTDLETEIGLEQNDDQPVFEFYSNFEEYEGWITQSGGLDKSYEDLYHSQKMKIRGGETYHCGWFNTGSTAVGGYYDRYGRFLAPLLTADLTAVHPAYRFREDKNYPKGRYISYLADPTDPNSGEEYYRFTAAHSAGPWTGEDVEVVGIGYHPDQAADDEPDITVFPITAFMTSYCFTAPTAAAYLSINLARKAPETTYYNHLNDATVFNTGTSYEGGTYVIYGHSQDSSIATDKLYQVKTGGHEAGPWNAADFTEQTLVEYSRYKQYVCSKDIYMPSGSGNLIIRDSDPLYQKYRDKKICIIGPSTMAINRLFRNGSVLDIGGQPFQTYVNYDQPWKDYRNRIIQKDTEVNESKGTLLNNSARAKVGYVSGFQEYLKPWFKEVKVFGYSGASYPYGRGSEKKCSIYTRVCGGQETVTWSVTVPEFDETETYTLSDYVKYQGDYYIFTSYHVPGPWNPDEVNQVSREEATTGSRDYDLPPMDLSGYDVFYLSADGNGTRASDAEYDYTSRDKENYLGSLRLICEYILSQNPRAEIYLSGWNRRAVDWRKYLTEQTRLLAGELCAGYIDFLNETDGTRTEYNYMYLTYEGKHCNNQGNRGSGLRLRKEILGF